MVLHAAANPACLNSAIQRFAAIRALFCSTHIHIPALARRAHGRRAYPAARRRTAPAQHPPAQHKTFAVLLWILWPDHAMLNRLLLCFLKRLRMKKFADALGSMAARSRKFTFFFRMEASSAPAG